MITGWVECCCRSYLYYGKPDWRVYVYVSILFSQSETDLPTALQVLPVVQGTSSLGEIPWNLYDSLFPCVSAGKAFYFSAFVLKIPQGSRQVRRQALWLHRVHSFGGVSLQGARFCAAASVQNLSPQKVAEFVLGANVATILDPVEQAKSQNDSSFVWPIVVGRTLCAVGSLSSVSPQ